MRGETQRVAERVRELLDLPSEPSEPSEPSAAPDEPEPPVVPDEPVVVVPTPRRAAVPWWRRLVARVPVRLDPGRRAAVGVGAAVLAVAVVAGAWLWLSGPRASDLAAPSRAAASADRVGGVGLGTAGPAPPGATGVATSTASSAGEVVVDVAGRVARPGLYHLSAGARIADALAAAGGARSGVDLTSINLAARVSDGQQIVVGVAVPGGSAVGGSVAGGAVSSGGSGKSSGAVAGPVPLNSATLEQLETLPGIGPALAQRIVDYRSAHGPFTAVDQLNDVSGIGDVKFAALKPLVSL